MFVPAVIVAGPSFATATSALTVTSADAVELLSPVSESPVVLEMSAVLETEPVASDATLATSSNVAASLAANVARVQVTVPFVPAGGVVQLNVGPPVWLTETNVVSAGRASVRD